MSNIDVKLKEGFKNILNGPMVDTRMFWQDGTPAKHRVMLNEILVFKPEDGFPIATSKFVPKKSSSTELDWIWMLNSNKVQDLRDMGSKVWNEWELEDGTIGKSYGYQLGNMRHTVKMSDISTKTLEAIGLGYVDTFVEPNNVGMRLNQVDYVIHKLIDDPYDKGIITTLWNVDDLPEMSLRPCVFQTQWSVLDGKLYLTVYQRSADGFLGKFFNISQYGVLHRLMAHITGWELGDYTHVIGNSHVYDRHIPLVEQYIDNPEFEAPEFWIDPTVKAFKDFRYGKNYDILNYSNGVGNAGVIKGGEVTVTIKELERLQNKKDSV